MSVGRLLQDCQSVYQCCMSVGSYKSVNAACRWSVCVCGGGGGMCDSLVVFESRLTECYQLSMAK